MQKQDPQQNMKEISGAKEPAGIATEEAGQGEFRDKSQNEKAKIPVLRTFQGDISEYIKDKAISMTEIAAEASKQRRFDGSENSSRRFFVLIGGIILLAAGLVAAGWLIFFKESLISSEPVFQPSKSLIFSEKQKIAVLKSENRSELIDVIQQNSEESIASGTIIDTPFLLETKEKKEFLRARSFFDILGIALPANLGQSLEGAFTFGFFYQQKFLILKINSFDLAFSGALSWERNMVQDLKDIFQIEDISAMNQKFQDRIIKNHDARVLYDTSDNIIIVYTFIERQYFAIATDINTLEEIIYRFSASH